MMAVQVFGRPAGQVFGRPAISEDRLFSFERIYFGGCKAAEDDWKISR
jgi:hypothetical protein